MGLMYSPRSTGGGNATVPNDAPILPAQAYVDSWIKIDSYGELGRHHLYNGTFMDFYINKGITSLSSLFIQTIHDVMQQNGYMELDLSGNAMSVASVNAVLAGLVDLVGNGSYIDVSGGTNGAPTGQGITDKNALIANTWNVTTN